MDHGEKNNIQWQNRDCFTRIIFLCKQNILECKSAQQAELFRFPYICDLKQWEQVNVIHFIMQNDSERPPLKATP